MLIAHEFHIQPSEIDRMVFFEYEYLIEDIKEYVEEQKSEHEKQEKGISSSMPNMNSMMNNMKSNMSLGGNSSSNFSMPKMPSFSMPKL